MLNCSNIDDSRCLTRFCLLEHIVNSYYPKGITHEVILWTCRTERKNCEIILKICSLNINRYIIKCYMLPINSSDFNIRYRWIIDTKFHFGCMICHVWFYCEILYCGIILINFSDNRNSIISIWRIQFISDRHTWLRIISKNFALSSKHVFGLSPLEIFRRTNSYIKEKMSKLFLK